MTFLCAGLISLHGQAVHHGTRGVVARIRVVWVLPSMDLGLRSGASGLQLGRLQRWLFSVLTAGRSCNSFHVGSRVRCW